MTTMESALTVIREIDQLTRILADDVLSLRSDLAAGDKRASQVIKSKTDIAQRLAGIKSELNGLIEQSDRFDSDTLGLKK